MPFHLKPIQDQVMVITGASSGIGLVTARAAARLGARVFLVARNEAVLHAIVGKIEDEGGSAGFAVADVGDAKQVREAAGAAVARFGRIDSWVNCAGVAIYAKLVDTPEEEHQRLFRTNYFGVVHGALAAIEHLRANGGALITVGSIAGDIPSPIMGAYDASKHAVKGYIDSLRMEIESDGLPISVTLIKPSGIDTPIAEHAANHVEGEALIPPPVYDPKLVADAILEAATHVRRAITVGGVGRLQVLAGTHFPGLLARLGPLIAPLLSDDERRATPGSNLGRPQQDGRERSSSQPGRRVSVYAIGRRRPLATLAVAAAALAVPIALARRGKGSRRSD